MCVCVCVCTRTHMCHGTLVDVGGQLLGVTSLPLLVPGDQSQVVRPGGECLYLLCCLACPHEHFLHGTRVWSFHGTLAKYSRPEHVFYFLQHCEMMYV